MFILIAESTQEWAKEYGNVFQLELLTNNRVRLFPYPWSLKSGVSL